MITYRTYENLTPVCDNVSACRSENYHEVCANCLSHSSISPIDSGKGSRSNIPLPDHAVQEIGVIVLELSWG